MKVKKIIIGAGKQHKTVLLDYTEKDGSNEGWREVEPYSFKTTDGVEFFFGHDIEKNGSRKFEISSLNNIKKTENSFKPRWQVEF